MSDTAHELKGQKNATGGAPRPMAHKPMSQQPKEFLNQQSSPGSGAKIGYGPTAKAFPSRPLMAVAGGALLLVGYYAMNQPSKQKQPLPKE